MTNDSWRPTAHDLRNVLGDIETPGHVYIFAGKNGAGKSSLLRDLAGEFSPETDVFAISNTVYDRFAYLPTENRISASFGRQLPAKILKRAIQIALNEGISRLKQVGRTLVYCGYDNRIGLKLRLRLIDRKKLSSRDVDSVSTRSLEREMRFRLEESEEYSSLSTTEQDDLASLIPLLLRDGTGPSRWLDFSGITLESSMGAQYALFLRWERLLRSSGILAGVDVYLMLQGKNEIQLNQASSGQLTLIASLAFLTASVKSQSVILIDEPENSLHPRWQKEYVERLLSVLEFRQPIIFIATHAPVVVSGAQLMDGAEVSVLRLSEGKVEPVEHKDEPTKHGERPDRDSLEETLFEVFDTVSPANHFVSESLSDALGDVRDGKASASDVKKLLERMRNASFDPIQQEFFDGMAALAERVEQDRRARQNSDG